MHHTQNHMPAPRALAVNRYMKAEWGVGGTRPGSIVAVVRGLVEVDLGGWGFGCCWAWVSVIGDAGVESGGRRRGPTQYRQAGGGFLALR
jgi:hypothetical protein